MVNEGVDIKADHPENQDPRRQSGIRRVIRKMLGAAGVKDSGVKAETVSLEPPTVESQPVTEFQLEWNRQSERLANLFAKRLRLTKEQYVATLPKFASQPEQFKGRFDIPVIVETRLPLETMLWMAGIRAGWEKGQIEDWDQKSFETPKTPYVAWLEDGRANLGKSVDYVRENLKPDERGGTQYDGISVYLRDPDILKHHSLSFPGSRVPTNITYACAPCLTSWGVAQQDFRRYDFVDPGFGSVVVGKL